MNILLEGQHLSLSESIFADQLAPEHKEHYLEIYKGGSLQDLFGHAKKIVSNPKIQQSALTIAEELGKMLFSGGGVNRHSGGHHKNHKKYLKGKGYKPHPVHRIDRTVKPKRIEELLNEMH